MGQHAENDTPDTAVSYLLKGLAVLDETGTDRAVVLKGTGITDEDLTNTNGLISSNKIMRLINNIENITGLKGIGLFFGSRLDITSHGMLGVATISQKNWKDAALLLSSGCKSRYHSIIIEPYEEGSTVGIRYKVDHHDPKYVIYICELFTATLFRNLPYFINAQPGALKLIINYQHEEPEYGAFYKGLFSTAPNFDQPYNEIMVKREILSGSLENQNVEISSAAQKSCDSDILRTSNHSLKIRVLQLLENKITPAFPAIAKALNMGERTLRRKLSDEGTTFRKIIEEKKNSDAKYQLENSTSSITDIAKNQGYYDPASFCKMFKKWNGVSPKTYRTNIAKNQA